MYDLALIIPCYNESRVIRETFFKLYAWFQTESAREHQKIALIFVDDGSTDDTATILDALVVEHRSESAVIVVKHPVNRGKGAAIKSGVAAIEAKNYGFIDADLAYDPHEFSLLIKNFQGADLVVGERQGSTQNSLVRAALSRALHRLVVFLTGVNVPDVQSGIKLFSRRVVERVFPDLTFDRFSFDAELIANTERRGLRTVSVPVAVHPTGSSTVTIRDGIRYLLDITALADRLKQKPTRFFYLSLAALAGIVTFGIFGWTLWYGYFFSDDFTWLWHGMRAGDPPSNIIFFRMSTFYSPVMNAWYAAFVRLFGFFAPAYFFTGLLVHAATSFLFGLILFQLTSSRIAAYVAVLLTAVAGGAYEPLVWIGANMHSIATFFIVAALAMYLRAMRSGSVRLLIFSGILFAAALGTKETAITFFALMLAMIVFVGARVRRFWTPAQIVYILFVFGVTLAYGLQQYMWQRQSVWILGGVWSLELRSLARLPIVIIEMFAPLSPIVTSMTAPVILVFSILALAYVVKRYAHLSAVRVGLAWTVITVLPTIFFRPDNWFDPIASRYTYLPRLGVVMVIAGILSFHVLQNTSRKVINSLAVVILAVSMAQVVSMIWTVSRKYDYVYQTGRTLVAAAKVLKSDPLKRVLVHWDRPFTGNTAHIVGVLALIPGIEESRIRFITEGESVAPVPGDALLYWDAEERSYRIRHL